MRWIEFECDQMQLKITQLQKEVGIWEGRAIKAAAELAEAKLAASRQSAQWESIETAPKDGTEIVALVSGHPYIVAWGTHGKAHAEPWWRDREGYGLTEPTHWIAIPSARRV